MSKSKATGKKTPEDRKIEHPAAQMNTEGGDRMVQVSHAWLDNGSPTRRFFQTPFSEGEESIVRGARKRFLVECTLY
jgi:hypothetical protein